MALSHFDAQGHALRPAILYGIDTRSGQEITDLNARFGAAEMVGETFGEVERRGTAAVMLQKIVEFGLE